MFSHNTKQEFQPANYALYNEIDCAEFSMDIYNEKINGVLGWALISAVSLPDGYAGACYAKREGNNCVLLFVHRGTILNFKNLLADLEIAMGEIPFTYATAWNFVLYSIEKFVETIPHWKKKQEPLIEFVQTGHSLGAVLAELVDSYIDQYLREKYDITPYHRCITFESPGSKPIADTIQIHHPELIPSPNALTYQAGVNFINSCNEQLASVMRLTDLPYNYDSEAEKPSLPIFSDFWTNPYYLLGYTLDQHSIRNIYEYLKKGGDCEGSATPAGFEAGYANYLNPNRKSYWDGFIVYIWDHNPEIREEYHTIDKYIPEFYRLLQIYHRESKTEAKKYHIMPIHELDDFVMIEKPKISQLGMFSSKDGDSVNVTKEDKRCLVM